MIWGVITSRDHRRYKEIHKYNTAVISNPTKINNTNERVGLYSFVVLWEFNNTYTHFIFFPGSLICGIVAVQRTLILSFEFLFVQQACVSLQFLVECVCVFTCKSCYAACIHWINWSSPVSYFCTVLWKLATAVLKEDKMVSGSRLITIICFLKAVSIRCKALLRQCSVMYGPFRTLHCNNIC